MKPTKQQILDEPAGPRLDAWFCKYVLGNKFKSHLNPFYPSSNIAHAMEGVEKYRKRIFLEIRILPGIVYCGIYPNNPGEFPFIFSKAETLELAITRALLLWAIEKDK